MNKNRIWAQILVLYWYEPRLWHLTRMKILTIDATYISFFDNKWWTCYFIGTLNTFVCFQFLGRIVYWFCFFRRHTLSSLFFRFFHIFRWITPNAVKNVEKNWIGKQTNRRIVSSYYSQTPLSSAGISLPEQWLCWLNACSCYANFKCSISIIKSYFININNLFHFQETVGWAMVSRWCSRVRRRKLRELRQTDAHEMIALSPYSAIFLMELILVFAFAFARLLWEMVWTQWRNNSNYMVSPFPHWVTFCSHCIDMEPTMPKRSKKIMHKFISFGYKKCIYIHGMAKCLNFTALIFE